MTAQARLLGGRYQVGELLGYGGMAEVHLGRDLRLGRDVAIKTLRIDLARDDTFQMRFRREAQNAASLNHPAIVAVYDTGVEPGPSGEDLPYIVMEYVNGRTLKEVLGAEGPLQPRRALEITADISAALEFSHRHGIIHRDIKPGNVMLTQTGQVKVMDFGIARALASGASTMTQTSAVIGTAQYLSPEQARGEAVDARSDVYATGCVIFELLCGHPPFTGDNPVSVAYQHVREDAPAPSQSNRDVTPDIDAVTLKALAKNPLNRYQSAGEMRADLLRAAAGRAVLATPVMREDDRTQIVAPAPSRRVTPPPRRRDSRGLVAALVLLGILAVTALATGLYLYNTQSTTMPDLKGKTKAEAEAALQTAGLTGSPSPVGTNCVKDRVVNQQNPAGSSVPADTPVVYGLCVGPGQAIVPEVVGLGKDNAQRQLEQAKLKYKIDVVDSEKAVDTVVEANPAPRTTVAEGTVVTLRVSNGKMKPVPDVRNQTEPQARVTLRDAGFTNVVSVDNNNNAPSEFGRVTGQTPEAGSSALPGSRIQISIGRVGVAPPTPGPSSPSPRPSSTRS